MSIHFEIKEYGFEYGSLSVTRLHSREHDKSVVLGLKTPKREFQVYATKLGKIRIFDCKLNGKEVKL